MLENYNGENRARELLRMPAPHMRHRRMDILRRAKQFAPFAALSGFEDCIYRQELRYQCGSDPEMVPIYENLQEEIL